MREQVADFGRSRRSAAVAVALVFLLLAGEAGAQRAMVPEVYLIRLEGYLREPLPSDRGTEDLTLDWRRKHYRLQLTD